MTLKNKLKRIIDKHLKKLFATAIVLLTMGFFLLIGQNIMLSWFMDRDAISLIAQNISMQFKMDYTPITYLTQTEQIISENSYDFDPDILFEKSNLFQSVTLKQTTTNQFQQGQIHWSHVDLIDNIPHLVLFYKTHSNKEAYLQLTLPLTLNSARDSNVEGFTIIEDSHGNSIVLLLNEKQWENYHYGEQIQKELSSITPQNANFQHNFPRLENPIARTINNQVYGTTSTTFTIGSEEYSMQLFITEASITGSGQIILFTLITLFSLFGFTLFIVLLFGRQGKLILSEEEKVLKLISKGESEAVEFKSSLRWDYKNNELNKDLEKIILKSIAAFSNANGGKLLIGVQDNGTILGLENDYSTLKSSNADYFELHLRNLLDKEFGKDFCASQVKCNFVEVNKREIACITIKESDEPIYLNIENKGEAFFVRSGNSSRKIENLSELMRYVKKRF